jgi:hypothetical protein
MAAEMSAARARRAARGARAIVSAAVVGLVAGGLIGGVGGRLAMLLLRLTSNPGLHGLETDDGFTIGLVSSATFFLLVITAALGLIGGLVYLAVRAWLPETGRSLVFGALSGVAGGALVIRPHGVDFTLLEPRVLAIVLFVGLPAAYGAAVSSAIDRVLARSSPDASRVWFAGLVLVLPPLTLIGMRGGLLFLAVPIAVAVALFAPAAGRLATARPVVLVGRAGLAVLGVGYAVALADDIAAVL